jgi:hypothetical protein
MSDRPEWLGRLSRDAAALLQGPDTFEWLTSEAAGRLRERARAQEGQIAEHPHAAVESLGPTCV